MHAPDDTARDVEPDERPPESRDEFLLAALGFAVLPGDAPDGCADD